MCIQACSVCLCLKIRQDYICRIYPLQLQTLLLNDVSLINSVVSEIYVLGYYTVLTGQTPIITQVKLFTCVFSEKMVEYLNWLQECWLFSLFQF